MKRNIDQQLKTWKNKQGRKPLILRGARQVGKTYAITTLGSEHFRQTIKLDLMADSKLRELFDSQQRFSPLSIIEQLEFYFKKKIDPQYDLLFFDEIQESAKALSGLKYFNEDLPQIAVACAGSYLGIMANDESFPVGKVEYLSMAPCGFEEYLGAVNPQLEKFYSEIEIEKHDAIEKIYHDELLKEWRRYTILGGMPEVLMAYINHRPEGEIVALQKARTIQNHLLEGHNGDFSKHAGKTNATHLVHVYESMSRQLAKSYDETVGRYLFTGVIPKSKGFEKIRGPLTWLTKSRLAIKVMITNKAHHPLLSYTEENRFKLYHFDTGLLQASLQIPIEASLQEDLGNYKGYLVENFVAQELFHKNDSHLFSWNEGQAEIEFLILDGKDIIPLEVKSSVKSRRAKSLDSYIEKYAPKIAYKVSAQNRGFDSKRRMLTIPIYLVGKLLKQTN